MDVLLAVRSRSLNHRYFNRPSNLSKKSKLSETISLFRMPEYPEPMIKPTQGTLPSSKAGFLVSFLVDARGGAMTGHRWQIVSSLKFYSVSTDTGA